MKRRRTRLLFGIVGSSLAYAIDALSHKSHANKLSPLTCSRRLFSRTLLLNSCPLVVLPWTHARAAEAAIAGQEDDATGESIRRAAANLPGLGPPDVFYPDVFAGSWKMHREIVIGDRTVSLDYGVRYLPTDFREPESSSPLAIADRGFNQANLEVSIGKTVQSFTWKATNPNDLSMSFEDGSRKDIKVTKRRTEFTEATVFSSEFQRQTTLDDQNGIPVVTARRILTKWKVVEDNQLEGLELVYNVAGGGDPMSLPQPVQAQQPELLSKSRLLLTRDR